MSGWPAVDVVGWVAWWNLEGSWVACEKIRNGGLTYFYGERDRDSYYELAYGRHPMEWKLWSGWTDHSLPSVGIIVGSVVELTVRT